MTRVDLYAAVHKGLRALLFGATQLVAGSDFAQAADALAASAAVRRLLGFLKEHAEHEGQEILPVIARASP